MRPHTDAKFGVPGTLVESTQSASIADLLRFTLPTLGIWLIGPILSLADTAFVGSQVHMPYALYILLTPIMSKLFCSSEPALSAVKTL